VSAWQAVQLACEELRKSLDKVAAEESGDLTWKELVTAAGNPAGFAPSKVGRPKYAAAREGSVAGYGLAGSASVQNV